MTFACVFINDIGHEQIQDICIKLYNENSEQIGVFCHTYNKNKVKLTDYELKEVRCAAANDINAFLENTDRIIVWDTTALNILKDIFSVLNDRTRYAIIIQNSKYNPAKKRSLNETYSELELCLADSIYDCKSMSETICDAFSHIVLELYKRNDMVIRGMSECISIPVVKIRSQHKVVGIGCNGCQKVKSNNIPADKSKTVKLEKQSDKNVSPQNEVLKEKEDMVRTNCEKYGLKCRIDFNIAFVQTWISSWYFRIDTPKIKLMHENRNATIEGKKFNDVYHNQKHTFNEIDQIIKYIYLHDEKLKERYR